MGGGLGERSRENVVGKWEERWARPRERAPWEAIWTTTSCSRVSTVCSRSRRFSSVVASVSSLAWAGESADKPSTGSRLAMLPLPLWGSLGSCGDPPAWGARERRRRCTISSRSSRRSAASSRSSMPSDRLVRACSRASAASFSSSAAVLATPPPRAALATAPVIRVHAPRAGGGCGKESSAIASSTAGSCSDRSRPKRRMSTP